jgi:la-related protein 1
MDSQGFVFLRVIANFNRMRQLTQDIEMIRYACMQSRSIEIRTGPDGVYRLRRKDNWQQWVLAMDERDPSAKNDGPTQIQMPPMPRFPQPHVMDGQFVPQNRQATSPTTFSPNGDESVFPMMDPTSPTFTGEVGARVINGAPNGHAQSVETPLSAAVPDFSPGLPQNCTNHQEDGDVAQTTFTDEDVEKLVVVLRPTAGGEGAQPRIPFHTAGLRTFSNGSIDERSIIDELQKLDERQSRPLTNGASTAST